MEGSRLFVSCRCGGAVALASSGLAAAVRSLCASVLENALLQHSPV